MVEGKQLYEKVFKKNEKKKRINLGVIILISAISFFAIRFVKVITNNTERGGLPYVQLLNFGDSLIEQYAFNEEDYFENNNSLRNILLETIGMKFLDSTKILKSELAFMNTINVDLTNSYVCSISPFEVDDNSVNKVNESQNSLAKELDESHPEVLIYHTHTTEAFSEAGQDTLDSNLNIVGVGNVLEEELKNKYGISVIHDTTNHCESYLKCYSRSYETLTSYLNQYGDFKLIIDLHRDSVDNKAVVTSNQNGEDVARLMFVNARNSATYANNAALSDWFTAKANELYPGLMRNGITYNSAKFAANSGASPNTLLIECGSSCNSVEEAKRSAKIIARLIAEKINGEG